MYSLHLNIKDGCFKNLSTVLPLAKELFMTRNPSTSHFYFIYETAEEIFLIFQVFRKICTDWVWCYRNCIFILKYRMFPCIYIITLCLYFHFHLSRTIHFTGTPAAWSIVKKIMVIKFLVENSNAVIIPSLLKPRYHFRGI